MDGGAQRVMWSGNVVCHDGACTRAAAAHVRFSFGLRREAARLYMYFLNWPLMMSLCVNGIDELAGCDRRTDVE